MFKSLPLLLNDSSDEHLLANETFDITFILSSADSDGFQSFVWANTEEQAEFIVVGLVTAIFDHKKKVMRSRCEEEITKYIQGDQGFIILKDAPGLSIMWWNQMATLREITSCNERQDGINHIVSLNFETESF